MMRMKVVFFFILLCVLTKVTEAFPSLNVTVENDDTGHDREKRDLKTDLNTLGIRMDDTYKKTHSECMALPSCAVILAKADKELTKIVKGAIAGKAVQDWFNTAQKSNTIQDIATATKKINTFLASQTSYIDLLERHESNPVLSVVAQQLDIVKESFQNVDDANHKVLNKFDITLLPECDAFHKSLGEWGKSYLGSAAKLKKYFEAPDQYMREKVNLTQKDYYKAKGAHFIMLNMITGYSKQNDKPKMCDVMIPSSNRTSLIQVSLALYNAMLVSARNTLLIGQITGENDLYEFKEDLKGCLKEASKEITECLTAIDGDKKATAKTETPDYNGIYDDNSILKDFAEENDNNRYWLQIGERLTKLNDDEEVGNIVDQYKNYLVNCVSDTEENGCKEKLEVKVQENNKATYAARISNGLESGSTIAEKIGEILTGKQLSSSQILTKLITNLGPFLGALGPIAAMVGTFSNSPEVQLLNKVLRTVNRGFGRIENKLEVIGHGLEEIKQTIVQVEFYGKIRNERDKVLLLKTDIDVLLYNQPKTCTGELDVASFNSYRDNLIQEGTPGGKHAADVKDALTKLHTMFTVHLDPITSSTWCDRARYFFADHRNQVMTLMMEYFNIWLYGAQSYIFTLELRNDVKLSNEKTVLTKQAEEIVTEIDKCEKSIRDDWVNRWTIDVLDWAKKGGTTGAEEIADAIYQRAIDKYYWRDWLVVVYTRDEDYEHVKCKEDRKEKGTGYTSVPTDIARLVNKFESPYLFHGYHGESWIVHVVSVAAEKDKIPNLPNLRVTCGEIKKYDFWDYGMFGIGCVGGNGHTGTKDEWYFYPWYSTRIYNQFPNIVKNGMNTKFVSSGVVRATKFAVKAKDDRHKMFRQGGPDGYGGTYAEGATGSWWGIYINGWYFG